MQDKKKVVPLQRIRKEWDLNAEIAQLVEHDLAKVGVASSSLVFRSFLGVCPGGGMVDALVSGASVERRASSSLVLGTKEIEEYEFAVMQFMLFFVLMYLLPAVSSFCHSDKLYFQWAWDCCISGQVVECLEIRKYQTLCLCVFV